MVVPGKRVIPKMEKERQGVSGVEYERKWECITAQGCHNVEKELAEVSTNGKGWRVDLATLPHLGRSASRKKVGP